jgi:hypothetical protein
MRYHGDGDSGRAINASGDLLLAAGSGAVSARQPVVRTTFPHKGGSEPKGAEA